MSKYDDVIERVFINNYTDEAIKVPFSRDELVQACDELGITRIKNLGDIPYTYRFRRELPKTIKDKCQANSEWIIIGTGIGTYEFRLASPSKIAPTANRKRIKVPDATPEIVRKYAPGTDEQALLTKVRYNRLVDIFTGLTCYSIQNHLRTSIKNVGQIEIDEMYIGVNKKGTHFVIPCQAKSPGDRFGIVQVMQDVAFCNGRYPNAICKTIALQFLSETDVAILELAVEEIDDIFHLSVADERQYKLVGRDEITDEEIRLMSELEEGN